jgi:hypothetical protein
VNDSGHWIHLNHPEVVTSAIRQVVAAARSAEQMDTPGADMPPINASEKCCRRFDLLERPPGGRDLMNHQLLGQFDTEAFNARLLDGPPHFFPAFENPRPQITSYLDEVERDR